MQETTERSRAPEWIAGTFFFVGLLWVTLSDVAVAWWLGAGVGDALTLANLGKGLGFITVSALALYVAMRWSAVGQVAGTVRSSRAPSITQRFGAGGWSVLALAVVLSTAGMAFGTWQIQATSAVDQARDDLRRSAFLKGGLLDRWLAEREGDAMVLAEARDFSVFARTATQMHSTLALEQVRHRLELMQERYDYDAIALIDRDWTPLVEVGRNVVDDVAVEEAVTEALASGTVSVPRLHANTDGAARISWAVPVQDRVDPEGPAVAVVVLSSGIDTLYPLLAISEGPHAASVDPHVVVRDDTRWATIARINARGGHIIEPPQAFARLRGQILDQERTGVRVASFDDTRGGFLAGVQPLAVPGWDLILKRDLAPLSIAPRQQAVWMGAATLFVWLIMLAVGALLWRQQWLHHHLELMRSHAEQDRLLRVFFDMPFVGMAISRPGGEGWERVNPLLAQMLGYAPEELTRIEWERLTVPEDRGCATELDAAMRAGEREGYSVQQRLLRRDGRVLVADIDVKCTRTADGAVDRVVATIEDITERREHDERQRLASVVFENTREGVVITDATAHILSVNRAFTELMGYTQDEVVGRTPKMFQSGRHDQAFYAHLYHQLATEGRWQGEIWNRRKSGEIFPELQSITAVYDSEGRLTHYVSVFADISRIKASEAELDFLAHHDPLTELPNRRLLRARLAQAIALMRRRQGLLAVLIIDVDRFKDINDSRGHAAGDRLLKIVADRLQAGRRGTDTVARLASDEFAVLADNLSHVDDAALVAEDILREVGRPADIGDGVEIEIAATIGIAVFPDHGADAETLLQEAGTALSRAKEDGRGSYRYYSDAFTEAARERIDLNARLRRAIEQDSLEVHYQPQYRVSDGVLIGAEALLRWTDPELGPVSPGRFIPVAEQTGLIVELGDWVLRRVLAQGQAWRDAGYPAVRLAVNVSALQFQRVAIDQQVADLLEGHGYPAKYLELEITESALMFDPERARRILQRLRERGVSFAVDDFGTGYSSMAQLKRFPVDTLKVDKSFVDGLAAGAHDADDRSIARAIVALGHGLGLSVLAEGVETREQLGALRELGCDHYQGYLASRPLPAERFAALLAEGLVAEEY
ncbi:bifunctional diguanylate cyclase/phosphodiesterase [Thioalkalivibrio sp. ALD1]|uniref:putative bifunctional diguanylate cyclase/phosphodiesterase n=1 Tax=Thioalkalivibrio sp. ALD1 TaxID=1158150 RepID=UPI00038082A2|nr:bifunctional diguanylate cyclase/phosphodiesterase [Thioalkalivibrio sp. ALD1]